MEQRACQNCKQEFTIEPEDFNYYEKISVPPPVWWPECRMIRRFSFQNTWNLWWRDCDNCGKRTLSIYSPKQKLTVYCQPCWWADFWDGTEYGIEYDPQKSFLEQVNELTGKTPFMALSSSYSTLKNSEYSNDLGWSKDCYLTFWADFCDNVFYSSILNGLKYSADCLLAEDSELCYQSISIDNCYNTFFSEECDACVNVWFSRNCYSCTNCIGCVNLRGASNYIFNVKYSKEEYAEKLKELGLESWQNINVLEEKAHAFWLTKPYREYNGNSLNVNVTGEYIYESRNCKEMYISNGAENCKWGQFITVKPAKDCYDYSGWGNNGSQIYESALVGENSDSVRFSFNCFPDSFNLDYCMMVSSGKNNFGCANLKKKKYCILNKPYSKEEYEKLKGQIIEDMKKNPYLDKQGRKYSYGEFFPLELSKFAYNKSNAMRFFPKTKEVALREGYSWSDEENPSPPSTLKAQDLPDNISEATNAILDEIIECASCKRSYKIVKGELDLLRKMGLPPPRECPKCRENKRFARMTKPKLYHRKCDKCGEPIYTPYAPEDPRIVYCVKDYQAEFL